MKYVEVCCINCPYRIPSVITNEAYFADVIVDSVLDNALAVLAGYGYPFDFFSTSILHYVQLHIRFLHGLITFLLKSVLCF